MTEPTTVTTGDTWTWTKSIPDYLPADGWVLSYALVNALGQITVTGSDNGDGSHLVNVAAATTAAYAAGTYRWQAYVTKDADRYTVDRGEIEVREDFASATTGYDGRSDWRKILDQLKAAYSAMLAGEIKTAAVTHNGRTVTYRSLGELVEAIRHAESMVAAEEAEERIEKGLGSGRKIYSRFTT